MSFAVSLLDNSLMHNAITKSMSVVIRLQAGRSGLDSRQKQGKGFFLFASASRPVLGPTQPPIQ